MLLVLVLLMLLLLLLLRGYLSDRRHLRGDRALLRRRRGEHGRVVGLLLREGTKHFLLLLQLELLQRLVEPGAACKMSQLCCNVAYELHSLRKSYPKTDWTAVAAPRRRQRPQPLLPPPRVESEREAAAVAVAASVAWPPGAWQSWDLTPLWSCRFLRPVAA